MARPSKRENYFQIARDVALRSPCSRRKFGAILVRNGVVIATGYNGAMRGAINCGEAVECLKDIHKEASYVSYNHCPAVHAEMNVILNAAREGISTIGSTLYLAEATGNLKGNERPCHLCRRIIVQAGITDIYYYCKELSKKLHRCGFLKWTNVVYAIYHERVNDWVKLENKWIRDQEERK